LSTVGDTSVIHGDIGLSRLVPVPLMGEGVRRLLSILLAIFHTPGGVVLIDEIENGLHYSVLNNIWKAIGKAARAASVQVFATTHSRECIRSADESFSESGADDFRLFRLDRNNGEISVVTYDHEMIEGALAMSLEIR
jgi:AAA15 family ATPase/GTPase